MRHRHDPSHSSAFRQVGSQPALRSKVPATDPKRRQRPLTLNTRAVEPEPRLEDLDLNDQGDDEDDSVLVVGHWLYAGRGHGAGQAIFAQTIAEDIADNRRIFRQIRHDDPWEGAA
jgi:hypothetical protein